MSLQTATPTSKVEEFDVALLPTIDFARLLSQEQSEINRLLAASQKEGFFYLDLSGPKSRQVLEDLKDVLVVMENYFNQPREAKMKDDRQSDTHGYKPVGTFTGVGDNEVDFYETLKIARTEIMAQSENLPEAVRQKNNLFDRFISGSHFITMTLLSGLSNALGLKDGARFEDSHRDGKPSRTILVLLRYPKQTADDKGLGHNKHTDIGSLTLLFSEQWGLQVLSPATNRWQFCMPKRDHAIINVGDSLRFLSGHQLHSCVHRVIPITQRQDEHRYSIAYFLRPEDDVKYQDSKGRILTAKEWHDNKYEVFREGHEKQEQDAILTGGMEKSEGLVVV